jgi:hypothetical protein
LLAEQRFDNVQPRPVLGCEYEFEALRVKTQLGPILL